MSMLLTCAHRSRGRHRERSALRAGGRARRLAAAVLALLLASCAGSAPRGGDGWEQLVVVTNPGTRSEGKSYFLCYEGAPIPDLFRKLWAGGAWYEYAERTVLWGDEGYVLLETGDEIEAGEEFTAADGERGWYEGASRKRDTPGHWFLGVRDHVVAWIDPERLADFTAAWGLEALRRQADPPGKN
ncbi:MAG TPA: hypothetical protein PK625_02215 [Spirochaetales bacterium]|nr:hypothetical protein [Spirochaetales bacterium]